MAELEEIINQPSEAEKRIEALSGKVKEAAAERDTERAAREAAEAKAAEAERTAEFYSSFTDIVASNPLAKDHKDEILTKVKAGYTAQDATYAVLGAAGKLGNQTTETSSPAGGSASTTVTAPAQKSPQEMNSEELRAALLEAEQRGDISLS